MMYRKYTYKKIKDYQRKDFFHREAPKKSDYQSATRNVIRPSSKQLIKHAGNPHDRTPIPFRLLISSWCYKLLRYIC